MPTVEQRFASYRDRGDLQALAAVFDALAPQLLLIAGHLVRDGALAEDLLQTTFLEAMRCARHYDARLPLLPWLSRILTNQARKLQRSRRRAPDPARLRGEGAEDPFAAVHGREVTAAVQQALGQLPLGYRQVLTLRLVHELPPSAIAHALGCPPETVKTRLKRGMALLRRHLPKGLGVLLAVAASNGRGLAAVRADVLAGAAKVSRVLPWTLASIGVLAMKQVLTGVLVVMVLALVGWWGSEACSAPPVAAPPVGEVAQAVVADSPAGEPAAPATVVRQEVSGTAAVARVVFRGRCVEAASGVPLAGCRAELWCQPGRSDLARVSFEESHDASVVAQTAADGCFELSTGFVAGTTYMLRVGDRGHISRRGEFGPWQQGHEMELGDLLLRPGVQLSGRVVDRKGHPVPGVSFNLRADATYARYEALPDAAFWRLRSGADGGYATDAAIASGRLELWWDSRSLPAPRSMAWIDLPAVNGPQVMDLVFPVEDEAQTIRGRAVDQDGHPVPLLDLRALGGGTMGIGETNAGGRFAIHRIEPFDAAVRGPVELTLDDPNEGFELCEPVVCTWGDGEVILRVHAAQVLTVRAVDSRTGELVHDFEVLCGDVVSGAAGTQVLARRPPVRRQADGGCTLSLTAADHLLQVLPHDPALGPSPVVRRKPSDGDEWRIELPLVRSTGVLVVASDGRPIAGTEVWALLAGDPAAAAEVPESRSLQLRAWDRWARYGISDQPIDHGSTDREGRVALRTVAGAAMVFTALGPGHTPKAIQVPATEAEDVRIEVERGASLRCRFTPAAVVAAYSPTAQLQQWGSRLADGDRKLLYRQLQMQLHVDRVEAEQQRDRWQSRSTGTVDREGVCLCDGLLPGHYEVVLEARRPFGSRDGMLVYLPLGTVLLADGETTDVERDLSSLTPCRVRAQVFLNGEPWRGLTGSLETRLGSGHVSTSVGTDGDGRFEVEIVPGAARLRLTYRHYGNMGYWFAPEVIQVAPGAIAEAVFAVRRVAARVRILTADGQPAPGLRVTMDTEGQPRGWQDWTTDEDGVVVIDPAPQKPFALVVHSPSAATGLAAKLPGAARDALLGPFQIPPSGNCASFEARLPDDWR